MRTEHPGCGVEKMYYTLQPNFLGRDRFIELFMSLGYRLEMPKNRIRTTFSVRCEYNNLIDGLCVYRINQVVQSDISYFQINNKFYYLIFIIDVYSKKIVGYQASDHMRATANFRALKQFRKLRGKEQLLNCIHHSDRGSQYMSNKYISELETLGCHVSVGFKAQENAYAERINRTIKNEYLIPWNISTFSSLKRKLKLAIDHYNHKRIHDHLPPRLSPNKFEKLLRENPKQFNHFELIYAKENYLHRSKHIAESFSFTQQHGYFCPVFYN